MAEVFSLRRPNHQGPGDRDLTEIGTASSTDLAPLNSHKLDTAESRRLLRKLLTWFYFERDRQSANRMEMATDHDFYDSLQWDEDDAQVLRERGQMPLVYNEVAPMCDWLIGTERRTRVDWKVLPRTEDDVEAADLKTKVLKYVSDVNRVPFSRSRAFADSIKGGVGWVDDGVRDDPTQEILYSRYEDWRNVLWDSSSYELDLSDARYLFRWRWVDEDIAVLMFPDREDRIRSAVIDHVNHAGPDEDEDTWTTPHDSVTGAGRSGTLTGISAGFSVDMQRRRVKLIECQYREPTKVKIIVSGPLKGAFFDQRDTALVDAMKQHGGTIIDKVIMRVHVAVMTESDLLASSPSIFRHNKFSLTPTWCYRRSRDRLPYGVIRRVRDVQKDLNKRASKALWLLNTNQVIADEGAVADIDTAREEAQMPDGWIEKRPGKSLEIRRDTDAATGQIQMMAMDAQSIQKSAGVTDENLGRKTNAVSGKAIDARQNQGAVVTTEPLDNARFAVQVQGEKQLSLSEQFFTEEKVMRLTGAKGSVEWVKINTPEVQPDGSVRYLNDITASMADFIVSEQDYAGTMRGVMFESLNAMAQRLPPEIALRMLTIAMEFSDLPNKDEIAQQFRKLTGDRDETKPMSPEEQQAAQEQMQQQAEALDMQRQMAQIALAEQQAKVREINAKAAEVEARICVGAEDPQGLVERAVMDARREAADEIDRLSAQLQKVQQDSANEIMAIRRDADTKAELAQVDASAKVRVAEIQQVSDKIVARLEQRIDDLARELGDVSTSVGEVSGTVEKVVKKVEAPAPAPAAAAPAPAPVAAPAAPAPVAAAAAPVEAAPPKARSLTIQKDAAGNLLGATVVREDGSKAVVTLKHDKAGGVTGGDVTYTGGG